MIYDIKNIYQILILFGLIIMPVLSFTEITTLMYGVSTHNALLSPWYIKGIKDFIFILIILIGIFWMIRYKYRLRIDITLYMLYFLILVSMILSLIEYNLIVVLAGIRWAIPLLLIPFLISNIDEKLQIKIAKVLMLLVFLGLIFQLLQTTTLYEYFGSNKLGFSRRNPGFFTIPSTMSIFLLFSLWYVYHFLEKSIFNQFFVYLIVPISVFLAGSATGLLAMIIFYFFIFYTKSKYKRIIIILSIIFTLFVFIMLPIILNRADLMSSLLIRMELYNHISYMNIFIGDRFGLATNTALLIPGNFTDKAFSTDGLVLSFIINIGLISFLIFVYIVIKNGEKTLKFIHFFMITSIFSFNSILFEVYPVNLLIAINLAYFISRNSDDLVKIQAD